MRKTNTQSLGEVIDEYLKVLKIDKRLKEVQLINSWEEIIGKTIARSTKDIFIKNRKIFIIVQSSVIRNELLMIKEGLLKALNDKAGEKIIDEVVIRDN